MRLFLDEAGNTGSIIDKNGKLNYGTQRHFCLASVVVNDVQEEQLIRQKYATFKERFSPQEELKGNSLFTREYNNALIYFLENILDDIHFSICLYDKKFYLASLLLLPIFGERTREECPREYYSLISDFSQEPDNLFATFCQLTKWATAESVHELFEFLKNYPYRHVPPYGNGLLWVISKIQEMGIEETFVNDFLQFGSYSNRKFSNLINLNALSELIEAISLERGYDTKKIDIIHDNISGVSELLKEELGQFKITIQFTDSKSDELIQLSDNVASIFCKIINTIVRCWDTKTEWAPKNEWILEKASLFLQKIGTQNIKFTVPIQSWALAFCVMDMFDPQYPKERRKNLFFNPKYEYWIQAVIQNIEQLGFSKHAEYFDKLYSYGEGKK